MGFSLSATGRRPAFGCFLGFPPGLLEEGGPARSAGPPSSTVQVNRDGPAQAGSWSGLRRGGGRGIGVRTDQIDRDEVGETRQNRRGDANEGRWGGGEARSGIGAELGRGVGLGLERFGCLGSGCRWWWRCCLLLPVVVSVPPLALGIRRHSLPRVSEGPSRLTSPPHAHVRSLLARAGSRSLAMGSEQGGPFRDLRASLKQRPMTDEARRSPDHSLDAPSRHGVTFEPQVAPKADRPPAPATFLSTDECARRAMLSRKAIYRAIDSGELLAFRVRARLRVPEEEFGRWMTADPVSRAPSGPRQGRSSRGPAPAGSFRSVLRTGEGSEA
jgi:excisionase family DNA binding protein